MSSTSCTAIHNFLAQMKTLNLVIAAALLFSATQQHCLAGSATSATNPTSGDWNTAANWGPQTVPDASSDIATFATSNRMQVALSALTEIGGINFNPGADSFTITAGITADQSYNLKLSGSGIVNSSGKLQTFLCGFNGFAAAAFLFYNSATAAIVSWTSALTMRPVLRLAHWLAKVRSCSGRIP